MKPMLLVGIVSLMLLAVASPFQLAAQAQTEQHNNQTHYIVKALSTLGGTQSGANSINNKGWITGWATFPEDQSEHSVLWRGQTMTDLGTLPLGKTSAASRSICALDFVGKMGR